MSLAISPQKVLIVEDHALLIEGIRNLFANQPRYEIVGTVSNGLMVYEACQNLSPDIVLLDLGLPGMDGVDVIHKLSRRWDSLRIVVITASSDPGRCRDALNAGALGYVLKQSSQHVLLAAVQFAAQGKPYIDSALHVTTTGLTSSTAHTPVLTPRECQVLKLIAEGKRNRDIAELLYISLKTVETHRLNIMRKLNAHNAVELANGARRLGIFEQI